MVLAGPGVTRSTWECYPVIRCHLVVIGGNWVLFRDNQDCQSVIKCCSETALGLYVNKVVSQNFWFKIFSFVLSIFSSIDYTFHGRFVPMQFVHRLWVTAMRGSSCSSNQKCAGPWCEQSRVLIWSVLWMFCSPAMPMGGSNQGYTGCSGNGDGFRHGCEHLEYWLASAWDSEFFLGWITSSTLMLTS